jgi:hypothetical protein
LTIAGVRDRAGNVVPFAETVTFTTGAITDLDPPFVTAVSPQAGTVDVAVSVSPSITFNEALNPISVSAGGVVLRVANTSEPVQATATLSANLRTIVVDPVISLEAHTQYTIQVSGATDSTGLLASLFSTTFTTGDALPPPPVTQIAQDTDGDLFPDVVEVEAGSNPFDPATTPVTIQSPLTQALSGPFSVLNVSSSESAAVSGEAVSVAFAVLNSSGAGDSGGASASGEVVGAVFAVLNITGSGDSSSALREVVGPAVSVLNTSAVGDPGSLAVFVGEAVGPSFSVENAPPSSGAAAQLQSLFASGPPVVTILSPVDGANVLEGQTLRVVVESAVEGLAATLFVNDTAVELDDSLPYVFTFTVPANIAGLTLGASVMTDQGDVALSEPVTLSVRPDLLTTVQGRVFDANGIARANTPVTVMLNGLRAEFFDAPGPLVTLPDLGGTAPTVTGYVTAVNSRNPDGVFGSDPFGVGLSPDYAVRLRGFLLVEQAGEYRFQLGADAGVRLVVNGVPVIDASNVVSQFQTSSGSIMLPAGLIPIEVTYVVSVGNSELQLQYTPPGGERQVVPPDVLFVDWASTVTTDAQGRFLAGSVPANVNAIRIRIAIDEFSTGVPPVPGGVTELGDVEIR